MKKKENLSKKDVDHVLQYKVEYLKVSNSKQDAVDLEILLNQYVTDGWYFNEIMDRKDYLLVIFSR